MTDSRTGDMRYVIDIYTEVAQKMQDLTKNEKIAITEGLAGMKIAV